MEPSRSSECAHTAVRLEDLDRRGTAEPHPGRLRKWTVQERQLPDLGVLRHDHEVMVAGIRQISSSVTVSSPTSGPCSAPPVSSGGWLCGGPRCSEDAQPAGCGCVNKSRLAEGNHYVRHETCSRRCPVVYISARNRSRWSSVAAAASAVSRPWRATVENPSSSSLSLHQSESAPL